MKFAILVSGHMILLAGAIALAGCRSWTQVRYGPWDLYQFAAGPHECREVDAPDTRWLQCALFGQRRPKP